MALFGGGKDENESGTTSGGGVGVNTPLLWNGVSSTGTGPAGDTPLLWNDPNTAAFVMGILDPTDIRTSTYPDIYILGNRHGWTHLGGGYWSSEGSRGTYYGTLLLARNPRVLFTGPEVTIILF